MQEVPQRPLTGACLLCFFQLHSGPQSTLHKHVSAANPHLLRCSQICPRLATFWPFYILRRYRRPPDHSQGLNYIILMCRIQRRCPFIVNPPRSDDLRGIAICRWCASATQAGHTFFPNRIYINLFRQIQTLRCIYVYPHEIFFIHWHFSLGHMSMDLPSVLAALSSPMVPSVTGTSIQVVFPQSCIPGLAGPEPSGPLIYPGHHLHGGRGYLNVVPAGPTPSLGPLGTQMVAVGTPEVTISLPLCCATKALRGLPCSSPECPRRATMCCQGGQQCEDPSQNQRPDGWN